GIAKGYLTEAFVGEAHREIDARLHAGGARVDAYYYCPHHPKGTVEAYTTPCECRKPGPGMLQRAARDLGLDLARSFMVGDKWIDVGAGRAAGARSLLVRTGFGAMEERRPQRDLAAD